MPFGYPYLLVQRAPQGLPRPQQCVPEPEPADHSRGPHIQHASSRHKPGSQAGPVPTAPPRLPEYPVDAGAVHPELSADLLDLLALAVELQDGLSVGAEARH